jgi:long-chain fatty acid transport protein
MKRTILNLAVLSTMFGAGLVQAGGFDRTGQDTSIMLKEGSMVEITSVSVNPKVTGTYTTGGASTGEVAPNYSFTNLGFRTKVSDNFAIAIIQDSPFGADVSWTAGTYDGTKAKVKSSATTLLTSYDLDSVTIYGGLKNQSLSATATIPGPSNALAYSITSTADSSLGYVLGAAIEKPEIAMRVALTYHSKISHDIAVVEKSVYTGQVAKPSVMSTKTPASFNLDFQTGIAESTLLFGSIRRVQWTSMKLAPAEYALAPGSTLKEFNSDTTSYTLGLGRKFSDSWSGAVTYGKESAGNDKPSALSPTNGYTKMGFGVTYTGAQANITLGMQKVNNGNATATGVNLTGNTSVVTAIKVGYKF